MRVSVLINNFNYGSFVNNCLQSLQNQSERPDEVIFYDDGSSDNSVEIASSYDFVKVISKPNFGKRPAFNQANGIYQAFQKSTGDIICLLDSDDFFHVDKIKSIKNAFEQNPKAVLVQNSYYEFRDNKIGNKFNYAKVGTDYLRLYYSTNWTAFFNPTSSLSFRRSYIIRQLPILEDDYWRVWPDVRLSRIAPFFGTIVNLEEPLTYYRKHVKSDSAQMNADFKNSFENQRDHHLYLNERIVALGRRPLNFRYSWYFLKFKLKAVLPISITSLIKRTIK